MPILTIGNTLVDLCGSEFLEPYLEREMQVDDDDPAPEPKACVRIVTYETSEASDPMLEQMSQRSGLPLLEIRCPYVVGTGMTGLLRRIAAGIYRGTYVHVVGNEARISVVHAKDVACAAALAAGATGIYAISDGQNPSIHDLSEAFAVRMADKRIITIKPRWARLWYGKTYFADLTSDHTCQEWLHAASIDRLLPDFVTTNVVNYLTTHVYSQQDI